jgi:hypothetical protein
MSYFERFVQWQNYAHYILLTLGVSAVVYYFQLYGLEFWKMLAWLVVIIFGVDSLVHALFWFAPEPIQWRD